MTGARTLRFVTGNAGKVAELQALLGPAWNVVADPRGYPEIQADRLEAVAWAGADHLLDHGVAAPFLLEDSGLFVDALRGFPGVYSRHALDTLGCDGLLRLMAHLPDPAARTAAFHACVLLVDADGTRHAFSGTCPGRIADTVAGEGGFGFDPVFVPTGHDRTFAQMTRAEKGRLSHRGHATRALAGFLEKTANP